MSNLDQCPSSKGKTEIPSEAPQPGRVNGKKYWRSLEEYAGTPEFKEFVEREFPAGASFLGEASRRNFVKIMGAGFALAGAATMPGCRRPDRKILPYTRNAPEEIVPGNALYYTTALPLPGGGMEGLLVETHTGRPTKLEGNPLHPHNQGKSSAYAQASVLSLYSPERLKYPLYLNPVRGRLDATWDDFVLWQQSHFEKFGGNGGQGLALIIDKQTSPTRLRMIEAFKRRYPQARVVLWSPAEEHNSIAGSELAFGSAQFVGYDFDGVKTVVSVGSDFMVDGPGAMENARSFARTRVVLEGDEDMSRLYAVEAKPTSTGSMADHRFRLAPSQMHNFALALAGEVMSLTGGSTSGLGAEVQGMSASDIAEIAKDLVAHRGQAVVTPGEQLLPETWAICMAINEALGALGSAVQLTPMPDLLAAHSARELAALTNEMNAGRIDTLVTINCNPVYDAPGALNFGEAFTKTPNTVTLGEEMNETEFISAWSLNGTHYLEQWGDVAGIDGTYSVTQPMIAPLYDPARSDIELLALLVGEGEKDGYTLVRETFAALGYGAGAESAGLDRQWKRLLHDGFMDPGSRPGAPSVDAGRVISAASRGGVRPAPAAESMDVVFYTSNRNHGQGANNGWLQELPEFGPSVVWDNPILMSPATAKALGVLPEHTWQDEYNPYIKQQMPQAQLISVNLGGREMVGAAWILPGMADFTLGIKLGYGRQICGKVGQGVGHNTYAIKPADGQMVTRGARISEIGDTYTIASTQNHWSLDGRDSLVRTMDKKWYDKYAGKETVIDDEIYGTMRSELNIAEKIGELSHTPPNVSIYKNPHNRSYRDPDVSDLEYDEALNEPRPPEYAMGPQWGMSIDMNACMGCNACTVACQAENNIPIVGKSEVAKGREMHWIRMDRYFVGDDLNDPESILVQPVACVHCENAPCETVCPVNATIHGDEGTNNMAYNRCIGTRYCANNCPYKVRRFNFFDYAPVKFNGGLDSTYVSKPIAEEFEKAMQGNRSFNQNFIPPRLRKKLDEISKMQYNPDVTVRSRGVMEKCTFCIQRIHEARREVKIKDIWNDREQAAPIPDGFFQVACQQACPSDAISFGDILDTDSRVAKEKKSGRSYLLLGYLNTRPRTTHMMRINNPNPAVRAIEHDPLDHGGHAPGHDDPTGAGHEDAYSTEGEAHSSSSYIDRGKKLIDDGYSRSLTVLGGIHA